MQTITLTNDTVKLYAAAKYGGGVSVTELHDMPSHFDLGRGSRYATVHFLGGTTEEIREHIMVRDNEIFDTEEQAKAFAKLTPDASVWQTLRGAVSHCPIEMQDEDVWVVTQSAQRRQISSALSERRNTRLILDNE